MGTIVSRPGLPLLGARDLDAPLAWRRGEAIDARQYLSDVSALARRLPERGPAVNLCVDRYAFAVALGAALVRGLPSLLPPDARADTLERLREGAPELFVLADDRALDAQGLPVAWIDPARHAPVDRAIAVPSIPADAHAVSLLTSGSTGVPQPHAKSWRTLVGDVAAAAPRLASSLGRTSLEGLALVTTVPVQHSYGLESSVLLALLGGASFDSGRPFFPADVAAALDAVPQPRALVTTPFHLKTLLLAGIAVPSVDLVLSATAPLSPQLAAQAEQTLGGALIEIYGSTESGQVASRRTTATEVWHTFGAITVRAEPATLDEEGTDGVGVGVGVGERFVFDGDFLPQPTPMSDVLELLDDRQFRLFGRANDLIHVAGRRSSLGHLNYHLNSVPGVLDGAFWLPDDAADAVVRPVAFVVAPDCPAAAVIAALRQRLEPVFVPRRVVHVAALPREGTGKLAVRALREFALAQLAADGSAIELTRDMPMDHPVFAGHFPGQPLVPGALLLAQVLEAAHGVPSLRSRLGDHPTLAVAKFMSPVRPGQAIVIALRPEPDAARGVRFEVRCGAQVAVSGHWMPALPVTA